MQVIQKSLLKFVEWVQKKNPPQIPMNHKVIVGLGNPGKRYEWTRHNLGWLALDELKKTYAPDTKWQDHRKAKALICEVSINNERAVLMKPLTFMNDSGRALREYLDYHNGTIQDLLVIYDEADLDLGELKIAEQGGSAGHNGIKSIIKDLKTDQFLRLRLGIKNKKKDKIPTDKFVLQPFGMLEKPKVKKWLPQIRETIECLLQEDPQTCMNKFH